MAQSSPLGRSYHLKLKEVRKKAVTLLIFFFFTLAEDLKWKSILPTYSRVFCREALSSSCHLERPEEMAVEIECVASDTFPY